MKGLIIALKEYFTEETAFNHIYGAALIKKVLRGT